MRQTSHQFLRLLLIFLSILLAPCHAIASQVLVTIEDKNITLADLETALASSPFYTQFNTLDEDEQAAMRGYMLKRLVTARLLEVEAHRLQLEKSPAFTTDLKDYIDGVRYQKYLQQLRESIKLSEDEKRELRQQFSGSADAFAAARSSLIASRYQALFQLTLQKLRDQYHVQLFQDRITPEMKPDTVLMQGDNLQLTYADLTSDTETDFNKSALLDQLFQQTEYMLISQAALSENMNLSKIAQRYTEQRLPALLVEIKVKEWIPDDSALQAYFQSHPALHKLKDRWHIGQLVVATRKQAEALRTRIINGERSLFQLASEFSIDPEARFNQGDLGWVLQGSGMPEIEDAIKKLKNNEISPVIRTIKGYNLITVLERRTGSKQNYYQIKDKLRQMIIDENMIDYLTELQKEHRVNWLVMENDQKKAYELLQDKKSSEK